ncbi:adenylosuccinate lyase [Neoactinobaculum massilliense]|uniref:adenylosuccinate lyase n=1 Tax=Neoactinobaculum massilliense TaxID=2364794 RepID=UPI000F532FE1|nr:adenylosuccinate lyase [Neoactinobaculum massilliense]
MIDFSQDPSITLGPLDGRYRATAAPLVNYLSEAALHRNRVRVEVEWLIFLSTYTRVLTRPAGLPAACEADIAAAQAVPEGDTDAVRENGAEHLDVVEPALDREEIAYLRAIPAAMGDAELAEIAEIERTTRHDVKAVEYFIKRRLDEAEEKLGRATALSHFHEAVHIFATSEDINNVAYALGVREALAGVWLPAARELENRLRQAAAKYADIPMMAHTHGQPATPTTVGKEMAVFARRFARALARVAADPILAKFNGATGTYGAHVVSAPGEDWIALSRAFIEGLGLEWNPLTTQIEPSDWFADIAADMAHANRIAHNLATDMWTYISLDYFHQNLAFQGSTGSSTMPHKVNPIRFENAEANLEISSALLETLAQTLVTTRMQRDLTDSTTKRNIGNALGHSVLAFHNLCGGLDGVDPNRVRLAEDLDHEWELLAEPIQQAMRAASLRGATGMEDPYERLKALTRGRKVGEQEMREFISGLGMPKDVEARLLALTPADYVGLAGKLAGMIDA